MRPTRAVVDLAKIKKNVRNLKAAADTGLMAVVKADGYGHGAVEVAKAALSAGAARLGVALTEEGRELRNAGIGAPILVMGALLPEDAAEAVGEHLSVALCDAETAKALDTHAFALGRKAKVHVKVDTGMGRVGIPHNEAAPFVEWASSLPNLEVEGIFSHFASSDELGNPFPHLQLERFNGVLEGLEARGKRPPIRHMSNTAAIGTIPGASFDLVRAGIGIYGLKPSAEVDFDPLLDPAMSWVTRITALKDVPAGTPVSYGSTHVTGGPAKIATLPVGYADGYSRLYSSKGWVVVGGVRAPVVGRVCMDMTMVDVTELPTVAVGDEVWLIGGEGDAKVTADELAGIMGTINYEITCKVGKRVPRFYENV